VVILGLLEQKAPDCPFVLLAILWIDPLPSCPHLIDVYASLAWLIHPNNILILYSLFMFMNHWWIHFWRSSNLCVSRYFRMTVAGWPCLCLDFFFCCSICLTSLCRYKCDLVALLRIEEHDTNASSVTVRLTRTHAHTVIHSPMNKDVCTVRISTPA
jgi:hypothetical protein